MNAKSMFRRLFRSPTAKIRNTPARTRLGVQELEERRNPGGSQIGLDPTAPPPTGIVYSAGEVAIIGTGVADVATAKYDSTGTKLIVSLNSQTATFDLSKVSRVSFTGYGGNDQFTNSTSVWSIALGGDGQDTLTGGSGGNKLVGGAQNDTLSGGNGSDTLEGNDGDDSLSGLGGNDFLYGGENNDTLYFFADSVSGAGTVSPSGFAIGGLNSSGDRFRGDGGYDTIVLTGGNDALTRGPDSNPSVAGVEKILGGTGNDVIDLGGTDTTPFTIYGEGGKDLIASGAGGDILYGGTEDDTLYGGDGVDTLVGEAGNDTLYGEKGNDTLLGAYWGWGGEPGNDTLYGGIGDDTLRGGDGHDWLWGQENDDKLYGENGNDALSGESGSDTLDGGWDHDNLVGGEGIDFLTGGSGNDTLFGAGWQNSYSYQDAGNYLWGNDGNDNLYGGNASDVLDGGYNNDGLFGGLGPNTLTGGGGADRFLVRTGETVADLNPEDARVTFTMGDKGWSSDREIYLVDTGLAFLHAQTNNTRLLKMSPGRGGGELTFQRVVFLGDSTLGDNGDAGVIRIADRAFGNLSAGTSTGGTPVAETVIHEIGHNWDDDTERGQASSDQWLALSGWQKHNNGSTPTGYAVSKDGVWDYKASAENQFFRDYGKTNPREDWSTTWEAYFRYKNGTLSATDTARLQAKLNFIDAFMASQRT